MKILISSVGTATSVNLIKCFKREFQFDVIGTDINEKGYTAGSLLVDNYYQVPYAYSKDYLDVIMNILEKENINLFIPINDAEIEVIARYREKIKCNVVIPELDILNWAGDKKRCNDDVRSYGISVPAYVGKDFGVKRIVRDRVGVGSKGIWIYEKNDTICQYDNNKQIIQEYIVGNEYTIDVLSDRSGKPLYIIPRQRLEVKCGVATKVEIVYDQELIELSKRILEKKPIPGFSNIQFIKDSSGINWFIEVNCRFSGSGASTLLACPDMARIFLDMLNNNCLRTTLNMKVHWGAIVTRYYEEIIYLDKIREVIK